MPHIYDTEFIEVSIPVLQHISGSLQFDIYIRRASNTYSKIFPKGEPVDQNRVMSYRKEKHIENMFVHKDDYRQYLFYAEQVANNFLAKPDQVSADELVRVVKEMTDLTMIEIYMHTRIDQVALDHASKTVKGCIEALARHPKSLVKIFTLMARHPYIMKHSLATSIFSLLLAKAEKLESEKTLLSIGIAALVHDIGVSRLSFDAEDKEELSPAEWKEMKTHPQLGASILDSIKQIAPEVRTIVLQHHEQPNGGGYPNGLHDREIYYLAKIVAIADNFSALVSKRPFREEPFSPTKALEIMVSDRGKYDSKLLTKFSKLFISVKTTTNPHDQAAA